MSPSAPRDPILDLFYRDAGVVPQGGWRRFWRLQKALDILATTRVMPGHWRARRAARLGEAQRVLMVAVEVPGREDDLRAVARRIMEGTRHHVTLATAPMRPQGKFDNINDALRGADLESFDWLLVIDDDIVVPGDFLDVFLHFARRHQLKLAQPAHRFRSFSTFAVTERRWGSLTRQTAFVEIGPVTLLHRDTFAELLPFPRLRWAWGLDFLWADIARRRGWRMGVVDVVPIGHMRPVAESYDGEAARQEGATFLRSQGFSMTPDEVLRPTTRLS